MRSNRLFKAISSRNWAELGKEPETPMWPMVAKVYGKDTAQALRKSLNEALDYETNYIKSYSAELSYGPRPSHAAELKH
ncbi:MAG: hypothetical protein ACREPQ_20380 [Rhodanobacter sp.]